MKSSAQATSFRSPNRSILDESDDISVTDVDDDDDEDLDVLERSFDEINRVVDESACLDSSFLREAGNSDNPAADDSELQKYKAALEAANTTIRNLHLELKKNSEEQMEGAPVIQEPLSAPSEQSPSGGERRMVNVRMLDGENFVTDWDELAPPLPEPPEHDLRSPIVTAVLEEWTSDRNLHQSLLAWIDEILAGSDPASVPPLTLSGLNHQVRDGFTLHVLPLLLWQRDIRLDVKTRIHRRTSYDLAISVERIVVPDLPHLSNDVRGQLETTSARSEVGSSATNSSAATALVSNTVRRSLSINTDVYSGKPYGIEGVNPLSGHTVSSRLSYDEMAEDIASSDDGQHGLMSALGGALGGLLARRKGTGNNHESLPPNGPQGGMQTILESPASVGLAHEIVGLAEHADDDLPYHRVVSAPPGRIGVTFVEYRGHCMVSDVYPDSPLIGWIFPSDVLIAIDDLPVSGMRVRDIIKVLKDRTNAQRALRVISSHAMNEFTLNASAVADESG